MADIFDPAKRSAIMSRVKGRGNVATEFRLMALFRAAKITGWRRQYPLFGKPDFVFPKHRLAVFTDGDFWHGHPKRSQIPATNREFWEKKIARNKARDELVNETLRTKGWQVVRIWQSDLRRADVLGPIMKRMARSESTNVEKRRGEIPPIPRRTKRPL